MVMSYDESLPKNFGLTDYLRLNNVGTRSRITGNAVLVSFFNYMQLDKSICFY